jgi:large subunit ribosomal protein L30
MKVKLVKSLIGRSAKQLATAKTLGLKKIGDVVEIGETESVKGQVDKLKFLLEVIPGSQAQPATARVNEEGAK